MGILELNWLAHIYLSDPDPAARVGNLLPDLVPVASLTSLSADILRGVVQHRQIDAFTDTHPIVRQSVARFAPPYRRFGGILADLFYDHFLAKNWHEYAAQPLVTFVESFYTTIPAFRDRIPSLAYERLEQIRTADWLCSYGSVAGIAKAAERIGARFSRPVDLGGAMRVLETDYANFESDFRAFLPEVQAHLRAGAAQSMS